MDINSLAVLTQLSHRWGTIETQCAERLADESAAAALSRLIAALKLAKNNGLAAGQIEAESMGRWMAAQSMPFSIALEVIFQVRKATRPFLVREYPGVEGFLEGQLQFEEVCNHLLKSASDGYCPLKQA